MNVRIFADKQYGNRIELRMISENKHAVIEWVEHQECDYVYPTAKVTVGEAQALMDDLWRCGLRPSEGEGSAGQSAAQQQHIADLRAIAFKALKIGV